MEVPQQVWINTEKGTDKKTWLSFFLHPESTWLSFFLHPESIFSVTKHCLEQIQSFSHLFFLLRYLSFEIRPKLYESINSERLFLLHIPSSKPLLCFSHPQIFTVSLSSATLGFLFFDWVCFDDGKTK